MHTDIAALPESVLVERAQDGDDRAFEALVRRHQDVVYRIALRTLGNPAEARDTAQEALITAWRKLPDLRDPHTFPAWLHRVVGRLVMYMIFLMIGGFLALLVRVQLGWPHADIPILGNAFKNRQRNSNKQEMLVFITPKMITERAAAR